MPPKVIVVVGPTSSGKSDLAVTLAKKFDGEVISADSRQVYRGMDIGTGKVPRDFVANRKLQIAYRHKGIPHHLLDIVSPKRTFTVVEYKKHAEKALKDILRRGKLPIITGGTGFYIDALLYDMPIPNVQPNKRLRKKLEKSAADELYRELKKLDPRRAKTIDRRNKRRLIRALEIIHETNAPIPESPRRKTYSQVLKNLRIGKRNVCMIGIALPPKELKKKIHTRLMERLRQGMVAEVRRLHVRGVSWKRLHDLGLEYRAVAQYLREEISKQELVTTLEREIWQYAKRQMTWWRRDSDVHWITNKEQALFFVRKSIAT